ncbi:PRC-barrel domain-containing protein [Leucobacter chromiiresistens]|uniref:PRC-barrel domain-containing protein n=1 Tax=Leucobacter chromiiresistens TaxID=1079994 RepID=A0A1H0YK94_9MICO|nr:PRC-barrel domain-containing protein [Leucobacter chromiiresistens]SDQ15655.1 PRC-barrel domain-containing protein [Leucobacter chromiiresistens]
MIDPTSINSLFDAKVFDVSGEKIGTVKQVFVGPDRGEPLFVSVATGLFGTSESFVPLRGATFDGEAVRVAYDRSAVKDAPRIDADGVLSDEEHERLWQYYDGDDDRERDGNAEHAADAGVVTGRVRLRKHGVAEDRGRTAEDRGAAPERGGAGAVR